jgi:NarL family two-component system response regulator LiaR
MSVRSVEIRYGLTPRQWEVLKYLVDGLSDRDIALRMDVSVYTVNKHVGAVRQKLGVASRTEAAVKAIREGLLG